MQRKKAKSGLLFLGLDFKAENVAALGSDNFEVKYDNGSYSFSKKEGADGKNELKFTLTGASNANADWTDMADESVALDFTWSVKKHTDSYLEQTTLTASDLEAEFGVGKPAGVTVQKVDIYNGETLVKTVTKGTHYTVSETAISLLSSQHSYYLGKTFEVTFSDGTVEEITIA